MYPTTRRISRISSSWIRASQNFIKRPDDRKGRHTLAHFWVNCKNIKNEATGTEEHLLFWSCGLNLIFLQFSQKCARVYPPFRLPVILSFMKFCVAQTSITHFFSRFFRMGEKFPTSINFNNNFFSWYSFCIYILVS